MFEVQTKNEKGEWETSSIWKPKTKGDAMNGVDVLFRLHACVRALENGKTFYSREQGKSNARKEQ